MISTRDTTLYKMCNIKTIINNLTKLVILLCEDEPICKICIFRRAINSRTEKKNEYSNFDLSSKYCTVQSTIKYNSMSTFPLKATFCTNK